MSNYIYIRTIFIKDTYFFILFEQIELLIKKICEPFFNLENNPQF